MKDAGTLVGGEFVRECLTMFTVAGDRNETVTYYVD
jgi:hypothetical protein